MLRGAFKLGSVWAYLALMTLLLLQPAPVIGAALKAAGAAQVAGWLVHICLLSLVFEAATRRAPIAVILIPILVYTTYYLAVEKQAWAVARKSAELRAANPVRILDFDPTTHSLVMPGAGAFATTHKIPVAYAFDPTYKPEEFLSFRLVSQNRLDLAMRESRDRFRILDVRIAGTIQPNVRELDFAERPPKKIVSVSVRADPGGGWRDWEIDETSTGISVDGKVVGAFKSASVRLLPRIPFFTIGCDSNNDPRDHRCGLELLWDQSVLDTIPEGVDRTRFDDPVSIMLGIERLTPDEIKSFQGVAPILPDSAPDASRARQIEDDSFATLKATIDGRYTTIPWTAAYAIGSNPRRLAPLAAGMVDRILALNRTGSIDAPDRRQQSLLLAAGIAALPQNEFLKVGERVSELVRREGGWDDLPALYLRSADLGAQSYSFYRDRFLQRETSRPERLLAAVAICRIGFADDELVSQMKVEFTNSSQQGHRDDNYKAALFVALLKLGQDAFLKANLTTDSISLKEWFEAVLASSGKTDVGPNNCMPLEWPRAEYIAWDLSPKLHRIGSKWVAAERE